MEDKTFKASNGRVITVTDPDDLAEVKIYDGYGQNMLKIWDYLADEDMEALEEYSLAKRDEELGRWRDKDYPEYVVYPKQGSVIELEPGVRVVNETTGRSKDIGREVIGACDAVVSRYGKVAQAYFKAHELKKPWLDAKPGEVWILNFVDFPKKNVSSLVKEGVFTYNDPCCDGWAPIDSDEIVSARRIWPEGKTNE